MFTYLFLAALGLYCCAWAFSSCSEHHLELLFMAAPGPLGCITFLLIKDPPTPTHAYTHNLQFLSSQWIILACLGAGKTCQAPIQLYLREDNFN